MKINETMIRKIVTETLRESLGKEKRSTADTRADFFQGAKDVASAGGVTAQEKALLSTAFKRMLAAARKGTINSGLPLQHLQRFLDALTKISGDDGDVGDVGDAGEQDDPGA